MCEAPQIPNQNGTPYPQPDSLGWDDDSDTESDDECRAQRSRRLPIVHIGTTTLRAVAVAPGRNVSEERHATYTVLSTWTCSVVM